MLLINKSYTPGDVVSLKLINGDEIIARLEEETTEEIKLTKPLAITIGPQGLGMMPWMFLGDNDTINLKRSHVFTIMVSKKDAAKQYLEGTTGISLAM